MNIDLLLAEHLPEAIRDTREEIASTTGDLAALRAKLHRLEDIANAAGVYVPDYEIVEGDNGQGRVVRDAAHAGPEAA